jgi:Bromodomain/PHD-finger
VKPSSLESVPCSIVEDAMMESAETKFENSQAAENLESDLPEHSKRLTTGKSSKIHFKATQNDGNLIDIGIYHRGREGAEIRDEHTAELLYDEKFLTDTNSGLDTEPKSLSAPVTIQFPLDDANDHYNDFMESNKRNIDDNHITAGNSSRGSSNKGDFSLRSKQDSCRYFSQTIRWDLASAETPTPMAFAAGIAQEFGLSYMQTLDLEESIQQQLQTFVQENCSHTVPIALRGILSSSPSQQTLDLRATQSVPTLYGEVTGSTEVGGICRPVNQKSKTPKFSRSPSILSTKSTVSKASDKELDRIGKACAGTTSKTKPSTAKRKGPKSVEKQTKATKPTKDTKELKPVEIFYWQVRSRLHAASLKDIKDRGTSEIIFYKDYMCHICHVERAVCGVFGCCILTHAYCEDHLIEKLQLNMHPEQTHPLSLDYCPVCSLSCDCNECTAKLDSATHDFRKVCSTQKATPETVLFENLFEHCKLMKVAFKHITGVKKRDSGSSAIKMDRRRSEVILKSERRVVPKIPPIEFPREVADGVDLDYGYEIDYCTIFTPKGSFIAKPHPVTSSSGEVICANSNGKPEKAVNPPSLIEDGNVDYCNTCRRVGNLLCCDFCPRAFHTDCVTAAERNASVEENEKWQCPVCRRELEVLPDDKLTGDDSLTTICAAFNDLGSQWENRDLAGLKVLSIVHDMLLRLMSYDFGYMFRIPVDVKQIPSYTTIVKKPMDLSTISTNLMKGMYKDKIRSKETVVDDIVLAVLKDVELVWHNCFMFNSDGSAVYRMAEVQRNRSCVIRKVNFEHLLSLHVKEELSKFIEVCRGERGAQRKESPSDVSLRNTASRQKAKHKIMGTSPFRGGKGRPVAILDGETGRIVKIYATMQSACNVVNFFFDMKFDCELMKDNIMSLNRLRAFILQSKTDLACRLFGYRWLLLQDLRDRRVAFPATKGSKKPQKTKHITSYSGEDEDVATLSCLIEMVDGDRSYIFNSIEESLSFPGIEADLITMREQLVSLSPGFDFTDAAGRRWKNIGSSARKSELSLAHNLSTFMLGDDGAPAFIKEDLISDTTLMGFRTADAAFHDWLSTIDASVVEVDDRSFEAFHSQYLDGNRNIDGICWRASVKDISNATVTSKEIEKTNKSLCTGDVDKPEHSSSFDTSIIVTGPVEGKLSCEELKNGVTGKYCDLGFVP